MRKTTTNQPTPAQRRALRALVDGQANDVHPRVADALVANGWARWVDGMPRATARGVIRPRSLVLTLAGARVALRGAQVEMRYGDTPSTWCARGVVARVSENVDDGILVHLVDSVLRASVGHTDETRWPLRLVHVVRWAR